MKKHIHKFKKWEWLYSGGSTDSDYEYDLYSRYCKKCGIWEVKIKNKLKH